jgi:hypothetical protein
VLTIWAIRKVLALPILVRPMHPDKAGGLKPIGRLAFAVNYFVVVILIFFTLIAIFGSVVRNSSLHIVMISAFYLVAPFSIFLSLVNANRKMAKNARRYLIVLI